MRDAWCAPEAVGAMAPRKRKTAQSGGAVWAAFAKMATPKFQIDEVDAVTAGDTSHVMHAVTAGDNNM